MLLFLGMSQLKGKPPYGIEKYPIIILTPTQELVGYKLGSQLLKKNYPPLLLIDKTERSRLNGTICFKG